MNNNACLGTRFFGVFIVEKLIEMHFHLFKIEESFLAIQESIYEGW
jgi:hypothetical protein